EDPGHAEDDLVDAVAAALLVDGDARHQRGVDVVGVLRTRVVDARERVPGGTAPWRRSILVPSRGGVLVLVHRGTAPIAVGAGKVRAPPCVDGPRHAERAVARRARAADTPPYRAREIPPAR